MKDEPSTRLEHAADFGELRRRVVEMLHHHVGGDEVERRGGKGQSPGVGTRYIADAAMLAQGLEVVVDAHDERNSFQQGLFSIEAPFGQQLMAAADIQPRSGTSGAGAEVFLEVDLRISELGHDATLDPARSFSRPVYEAHDAVSKGRWRPLNAVAAVPPRGAPSGSSFVDLARRSIV